MYIAGAWGICRWSNWRLRWWRNMWNIYNWKWAPAKFNKYSFDEGQVCSNEVLFRLYLNLILQTISAKLWKHFTSTLKSVKNGTKIMVQNYEAMLHGFVLWGGANRKRSLSPVGEIINHIWTRQMKNVPLVAPINLIKTYC